MLPQAVPCSAASQPLETAARSYNDSTFFRRCDQERVVKLGPTIKAMLQLRLRWTRLQPRCVRQSWPSWCLSTCEIFHTPSLKQDSMVRILLLTCAFCSNDPAADVEAGKRSPGYNTRGRFLHNELSGRERQGPGFSDEKSKCTSPLHLFPVCPSSLSSSW